MTSAIAHAVQEFLGDEQRRKRKRFSETERLELEKLAHAVELMPDANARMAPQESSARGEIIVGLFGYGEDNFKDAASDVVVDILWAVHARGLDPRELLAEASELFFAEAGED